MRTTRRSLAVIAAAAILLISAQATLAGNPFAKATTTAGGYHTWDSDLIDIENVSQTGAGVYVAVLDTGLTSNWADYLPKARVRADLGVGFVQPVSFKTAADEKNPCGVEVTKGVLRKTTYIGSRGSTHGTHVTSTIIGYSYRSNSDLAGGYPLPAIQVRGIAPDATIIPVRVLADYQVPAMPKCPDPALQKQGLSVFGTDEMVAAGINYVTSLKKGVLAGKPVVINMSLGGPELAPIEQKAIDDAVAAGVVVVASAGNEGTDGMGYPGAYAPVISVGATGWTGEWLEPGQSPSNPPPAGFVRYRMWWLQNIKGNGVESPGSLGALLAGSGETADPTVADDVYVTDFSSRELAGQDLDVLAPGSWVRGPYPGTPGYAHLPWWSRGIGDLVGGNPGNFYYVGGTSMASPHVAAVAALLLQVNPSLTAGEVESILESTALAIPAGSRQVWDSGAAGWAFYTYSWGDDATGSGQVDVPAAIAAASTP